MSQRVVAVGRLRELEEKIAFEAAKQTLDSFCLCSRRKGLEWRDIGNVDHPGWDWVNEAVEYLDLRGLLVRMDGKPHMVRVKEESCSNAE